MKIYIIIYGGEGYAGKRPHTRILNRDKKFQFHEYKLILNYEYYYYYYLLNLTVHHIILDSECRQTVGLG